MLEIESQDKGLLLPRISDTNNMASPQEALMIYDLSQKTPSYHNGNHWSSTQSSMMMSSLFALTDSMTYTIVNPATLPAANFIAGTFPAFALNYGWAASESLWTSTISVPRDTNSIAFI